MEMQLTITIDPVEFRNQRELLFQLAGCLASADGVEGLISLTDNIADAMSAAVMKWERPPLRSATSVGISLHGGAENS